MTETISIELTEITKLLIFDFILNPAFILSFGILVFLVNLLFTTPTSPTKRNNTEEENFKNYVPNLKRVMKITSAWIIYDALYYRGFTIPTLLITISTILINIIIPKLLSYCLKMITEL